MECLGCGILCRWWWWNNGMIDKNKNYCSKFRNCPACSCGIWAEHRQKPKISLNSDIIWSQSELIRAGEAAQYENASYNAGCTWGSKEYQICTTLASFADIYYIYCQFPHNDDDESSFANWDNQWFLCYQKVHGKGRTDHSDQKGIPIFHFTHIQVNEQDFPEPGQGLMPKSPKAKECITWFEA